jgi:hypothetical protein
VVGLVGQSQVTGVVVTGQPPCRLGRSVGRGEEEKGGGRRVLGRPDLARPGKRRSGPRERERAGARVGH